MGYCTVDDLKKVIPEEILIQLTDDENTGSINVDRVSEAVSQSDAEIDLYIEGKYTIPLITVPAIIRRCSCDIAVYRLYGRRAEVIPETRRRNYNDALRILGQIRDAV